MALPVRKFREVVLQLLYSLDLDAEDLEALVPLVAGEMRVARSEVRRAADRAGDVRLLQGSLDEQIALVSTEYALERIQRVERNILRLGIYELLHDDEIPPKVAISEGVRLARKFSTPQAALFVNALLDAIYRTSLGEKVDAVTIQEPEKSEE